MVRQMALEGQRADGRQAAEVRHISSRASVLPCTHGSALFTRGETQSLAVATLGEHSLQCALCKHMRMKSALVRQAHSAYVEK